MLTRTMNLMERLRGLLRDKRADLIPRPVGWNKTLGDLDSENRTLSGHEIRWAREYEQEQLRSWARFPKDGEVFEALGPVTISYIVHYRAPYSGGGQGTLPAGTRLRVSVQAGDPEPVGVYAIPVEEGKLEELLVPAEERLSSKYDGYHLFLHVAQLNREFKLVPERAG
jgi:hypothetical protein